MVKLIAVGNRNADAPMDRQSWMGMSTSPNELVQIGTEYAANAIGIYNDRLVVELEDHFEGSSERSWSWHPFEFFRIVDPELPSKWFFIHLDGPEFHVSRTHFNAIAARGGEALYYSDEDPDDAEVRRRMMDSGRQLLFEYVGSPGIPTVAMYRGFHFDVTLPPESHMSWAPLLQPNDIPVAASRSLVVGVSYRALAIVLHGDRLHGLFDSGSFVPVFVPLEKFRQISRSFPSGWAFRNWPNNSEAFVHRQRPQAVWGYRYFVDNIDEHFRGLLSRSPADIEIFRREALQRDSYAADRLKLRGRDRRDAPQRFP